MLNLDTNINISQLLHVLQICDSAFPIGSFNHSYGMETYIRKAHVTNATTFKEWLEVFLCTQFVHNEGLSIKLLYDSVEDSVINMETLLLLDEGLTVQTLAKESRDANKLIASRLCETILSLYTIPSVIEYKEMIQNNTCYGAPSLVFACIMLFLKIPKEIAISCYSYTFIATMIQNAVRAIPLGQKDGQNVLKETSELLPAISNTIETLTYDDFGYTVPGLEIAQMNHEILPFRLFMS